MTDLRKAAQQVLGTWDNDDWFDADTLRAALAQPEQESVLHKWAALFEDPNNDWQAGYESARRWVLEVGLQSIAAPPQRKPLTEEQIYSLYSEPCSDAEMVEFARAIEKAHGIGGEHG